MWPWGPRPAGPCAIWPRCTCRAAPARGFLVAYLAETAAVNPQVGLLLTSGVCGGYTTFSTFSYETFALLRDGEYNRAGVYVLLSVGVSLVAMFAGFAAARGAIHLQRGA